MRKDEKEKGSIITGALIVGLKDYRLGKILIAREAAARPYSRWLYCDTNSIILILILILYLQVVLRYDETDDPIDRVVNTYIGCAIAVIRCETECGRQKTSCRSAQRLKFRTGKRRWSG
jgi:hypothetical protein